MAKKANMPDPQLDLTPIMNLVLVLIPMLLLSVVFITIKIIDVSMPQRTAGLAQNNGEPPKRLQMQISGEGIWLMASGEQVPSVGCPAGSSMTVCLKDPEAPFPVMRYDWRSLYNALMDLKANPEWSDFETIEINASPDISFSVLVKAMDISRFQLVPKADLSGAVKGKTMKTDEELASAQAVMVQRANAEGKMQMTELSLFPLVVLSMPTQRM